jgi:hypothetical protein
MLYLRFIHDVIMGKPRDMVEIEPKEMQSLADYLNNHVFIKPFSYDFYFHVGRLYQDLLRNRKMFCIQVHGFIEYVQINGEYSFKLSITQDV